MVRKASASGRPRGEGRKRASRRNAAVPGLQEHEVELYRALREVRGDLAREANVPPYIVCHDRSLIDMVRLKPRTRDELKLVHGMGEARVTRYGAAFHLIERRAVHANDALVWAPQARERMQRERFAAAVAPQDRGELPSGEVD